MKIKGRCTECGRDFPADLLLQNAGRCPFCGTPMDAHYTGNFVAAVAVLQRAGSEIEAALDQLGAFGPIFELDDNSLLDPIRAALAQRARRADAKTA